MVAYTLVSKGISPLPPPSPLRLLSSIIGDPEHYWRKSRIIQSIKIFQARIAFSKTGLYHAKDIARKCLEQVEELRLTDYDRPFFIMGPGGSGSHWLGRIIGDLPVGYHGNEIYIPPQIALLYDHLESRAMENAVWAYMLLNAWTVNGPANPVSGDMVFSFRSNVRSYLRYRRIWPKARWIYLIRDPRDLVLSLVYRKSRFRNLANPGVGDKAYFIKKCHDLAVGFCQYKKVANHVHVVKYEDLRRDTVVEIKDLLSKLRVDVAESCLKQAVSRNDAENIRKGVVANRGNLDEGGVAVGWRKAMSEKEMDLCRPILEDAVEHFGYDNKGDW